MKQLKNLFFLFLLGTVTNANAQITGDTALSNRYYKKGDIFFDNGDFKKAIKYFDTAIIYNPINIVAHLNRGIAYNNLNEYDSAIVSFKNLIELSSQLSEIKDYSYLFYLRAKSYYNLKKYEQALTDIDLYFKTKTSDENDVQVNSLKGQCLYFLDKQDSAIIILKKLLAVDANNFTANLYLGRSYSKINQEKARFYFSKAAEIDNRSFDAYKYWGYFENEMAQYADAKALLEIAQTINSVDDPLFFLQLAIAQAGSDEIEASISNFKKAEADVDLKQGVAVKKLELLAGNKLLSKEMAAILIDDINYLEPHVESTKQKAELIYLKAYYKAAFEYPTAEILKDVDAAIKLYPKEWKFYYLKSAFSQYRFTKHKEAIAAIDQAIKLKNIWKLHYFKAMLLNDAGLNKNAACACIKKAQSLPNDKKITKKIVSDICQGKKVKEVLDLDINQFIENSSFLK